MSSDHEKLVVIGTGAAGLTAAIYAARANLNPLVLAGLQPGGQLTITTDVENYPGFADVVQGPWLMEQMQQQAENVGARVEYELVTDVDFSKRPFSMTLDGGKTMTADSVIIATGAQARWLGLESETTFNGRGVSACATCDGFFYRDREVAVIGGGNTAVEEALYLANICKKVTLIHRRDSLRAEQIMQERLMRTENVEVLWNRVVDEVLGDEGMGGGVTGLRLQSTTGKTHSTFLLTACLLPLAMIRQQQHSKARLPWMMKAISLPRQDRRGHLLKVSLLRVTVLTRFTARLSLLQEWDVWPPLMPKNGWACSNSDHAGFSISIGLSLIARCIRKAPSPATRLIAHMIL